MTDLELFFAENTEDIAEVEYVASARFKDKKGKPLPWKLKALTPAQNDELKKKCLKRVPVFGNKGQYREEFDQMQYVMLLTASTVTFPDLNNVSLQQSWSKKVGYDIMTPTDLLNAMLTAGEYDLLTAKCQEVSGYDDINEDAETAKN